MNRRRFLSMLGALPAALALPTLPPDKNRVSIVVQSRGDFRSDLRYATILSEKIVGGVKPAGPFLIGERGPEIIIPHHGGTVI